MRENMHVLRLNCNTTNAHSSATTMLHDRAINDKEAGYNARGIHVGGFAPEKFFLMW